MTLGNHRADFVPSYYVPADPRADSHERKMPRFLLSLTRLPRVTASLPGQSVCFTPPTQILCPSLRFICVKLAATAELAVLHVYSAYSTTTCSRRTVPQNGNRATTNRLLNLLADIFQRYHNFCWPSGCIISAPTSLGRLFKRIFDPRKASPPAVGQIPSIFGSEKNLLAVFNDDPEDFCSFWVKGELEGVADFTNLVGAGKGSSDLYFLQK